MKARLQAQLTRQAAPPTDDDHELPPIEAWTLDEVYDAVEPTASDPSQEFDAVFD